VSAPGGLHPRFRHLIHEGAKFGVVGLAGVVIVLVGADILRYDVGLGKYASVTIATVAATVATFVGNRHWTFRRRERRGTGPETVLFFALNGVGLLIQYACIGFVQDILGMSGRFWYTVANFLGIGLGTIFRFWSYRRWVWQAPSSSSLSAGRLPDGLDVRPPAAVPPARSLAVPRRWTGPRHARTSGPGAPGGALAGVSDEPR